MYLVARISPGDVVFQLLLPRWWERVGGDFLMRGAGR